jgi:hypothetical protein
MARRRAIAALLVALATTFGLAACAPSSVTPTASPTPHHTHAAQAAVPTVRVPITCDALFNTAAATAIVGYPVVDTQNEKSKPSDATSAIERQAGTLDCSWTRSDTQEDGDPVGLDVIVAPDGAAAYDSNLAGLEAERAPDAENTAGDASEYACDVDNGCTANMKVGNYWVELSQFNALAQAPTLSGLEASAELALTTIAAALKDTTPAPRWKPPVAKLPTFCAASTSTAAVDAALASTTFVLQPADSGPFDAFRAVEPSDEIEYCGWASDSASDGPGGYVGVTIIRGGAWAVPLIASRPLSSGPGPLAPVTVAGATQAVEACSDEVAQCDTELSVGGNLVEIGIFSVSSTRAEDAIPALVKAINAS